ncbi:MAG: hypothetical protein GX892_14880 [Thermoanaerobacteraceae bacterium]|nr:hypothetical protein [Thermoanaerobacteraceae bacterium]
MLSNEKIKFTDREIIEKGSRALIKELGYSGFLRFIRQFESNGENYMEIQENLYKEIPLDVLFSEAQHNWERKKSQT